MADTQHLPSNKEAERQRVEELELDAAAIDVLKHELADERGVLVDDILFMGVKDSFDVRQEVPDADRFALIFLENPETGRPRVLPLVSDWRYRRLVLNGPYLHFESYGTPGSCVPWRVEDGFCYPGQEAWQGMGEHGPQPLSEQKWKNFLRTMDRIGVWSWQGYYEPTDSVILDGHAWSLEVHAGDRHVKCSGSNGYPDALGRPTPFQDKEAVKLFNRLERAVKRLVTMKAGDQP